MEKYLMIILVAGCSFTVVQLADVIRFSMEESKAEEQTNKFGIFTFFKGETQTRQLTLSARHPLFATAKSRRPVRLGSFQWNNCGAPSKELMVVESLSITPDPVSLPGTITVSFAAVFNKTVDAPLQVDLVLEKEVFDVWIKVPCVDNVGSCTYSDVCESLSKATCPLPFVQQKVPCKCPFNKGSYNLTRAGINIQASGIPTGSYRITANLSVKGVFVGCYYIAASLTD